MTDLLSLVVRSFSLWKVVKKKVNEFAVGLFFSTQRFIRVWQCWEKNRRLCAENFHAMGHLLLPADREILEDLTALRQNWASSTGILKADSLILKFHPEDIHANISLQGQIAQRQDNERGPGCP